MFPKLKKTELRFLEKLKFSKQESNLEHSGLENVAKLKDMFSNPITEQINKKFSIFLAFVITKTFTNLKDLLGDGPTFWLFSGLSILGTVFVFFVVPETKGKSLNEIQQMLSGEKDTNSSEDKN